SPPGAAHARHSDAAAGHAPVRGHRGGCAMTPPSPPDGPPLPRHVAIIMDGNGRWATERGLPRHEGHRQGAEAVKRVVRAARELGIPALTLYAFSEQNWGRPRAEVAH